jgi:tetratricopeptide (TPR) repeat protein
MAMIGRNDPCPCGSGKKYKKCCLGELTIPNSDPVDAKMQKGYSLLEKGQTKAACDIWLTVWEDLKLRLTPDIRSIKDTERIFSGLQSVFNWCSDLEMELHNTGLKDPSYFEKLVKYAQEFCTLLPDSPDIFIQNMKTAEAESYFYLGQVEQGEAAFNALSVNYPDNPWPLIIWGDLCCSSRFDQSVRNVEKAMALYNRALQVVTDEGDKEAIQQRLDEISF